MELYHFHNTSRKSRVPYARLSGMEWSTNFPQGIDLCMTLLAIIL